MAKKSLDTGRRIAVFGQDDIEEDQWNPFAVSEDGLSKTRVYFLNPVTLDWEPSTGTPVVIENVEVGLAANIGNFPAVISGDSVPTTSVANSTASGIIDAAGETVQCVISPGGASVGCQVTGTWVGQLEFEGSTDGTNWVSIFVSNQIATTNATAGNGIFIIASAGYVKVRLRASAWTSGTATINFNSSVGSTGVILTVPLPQGSNILGKVENVEDNKSIIMYEDGEDILYICRSTIGSAKNSPVWQVKKMDGLNITWAHGNDYYDNLATDLATVQALLPYS